MQRMVKILTPILFLTSCAFATELKTKEQKESYSLGASTGSYISNQLHNHSQMGITSDVNLVIEGFIDALKQQQKLTEEQIVALLNQRAESLNKIVEEKTKAELDKNLKAGKEFMAKNAKSPKVKTTKSGLQYEFIATSDGEKAKPESIVLVNYKAQLIDGKVFDDTYESKKPAHLSLINIIDGLSEGILLMNTGSKYKFTIPSELAYGNDGLEQVPPGSTVIFEVELLKVFKPGELVEEAKKMSEDEIRNFHGLK